MISLLFSAAFLLARPSAAIPLSTCVTTMKLNQAKPASGNRLQKIPKRQLERQIQEAIQKLNSQGIQWTYEGNRLVIVPEPRGSRLNQIAAGLRQNMKGLKLE